MKICALPGCYCRVRSPRRKFCSKFCQLDAYKITRALQYREKKKRRLRFQELVRTNVAVEKETV